MDWQVIILVFLIGLSLLFLGLILNFRTRLREELASLREKVDERLLSTQNSFLASQSNFTQSLERVSKDLGLIQEVGRSLKESINSFEDIFRKPTLRGGLGEYLLENIVKDILPQDNFQKQYTFSNGKIADLVIIFPQGILPVDSKFSLDTYRTYIEAEPGLKQQTRKNFLRGIKARIDETAKYIIPEEKTFEFAFMYVPSEAIYYEIITEPQIIEYAHTKKVFIVGPNTLYAYLKTILIGFEGLKVERQAKKILEHIKNLEIELLSLQENFSVLGSHLKNALGKYSELDKKLTEISSRVNPSF